MPKRIQRKRIKGWRKPEGAVYVGRPAYFQNPYKIGEDVATAQEAVNEYREYLFMSPGLMNDARRLLKGKDLICWCPLDKPCHADILMQVANSEDSDGNG